MVGTMDKCDPAGFVNGLNLYRYCLNNPVIYHDPNGTDEEKCYVMHPTLEVPVEALGKECHIPGMTYVTEDGEPVVNNRDKKDAKPNPTPEKPPIRKIKVLTKCLTRKSR